jgi:MoaA/NifB/PqqE/SkfB family radical SAM enzyme
VLRVAAEHRNTLFPVFTNGTLLKGEQLELFDKNRNLVPILSIEGDAGRTDARRGEGVYETLEATMKLLSKKSILFGASITVTTKNTHYVTDDAFLDVLRKAGCKVVIYVEYVPADGKTQALAPTDTERAVLAARVETLRASMDDMMFISFPGDEFASGGCLAAGRGFFHINPYGGAEPCPFSPYSDTNVRQSGILAALDSPLFQNLRAQDILRGAHSGGCVLFEYDELVKQIAKR